MRPSSPTCSHAKLWVGFYPPRWLLSCCLAALNQAIHNAKETVGLVHHSDHGSQYVSLVYNQRLAEYGITPSTGSVGDSYDNALAENVNGSYKNELIHNRRWEDVLEVEIATFEWMSWWNTTRLHENLNYQTPQETENQYWQNTRNGVGRKLVTGWLFRLPVSRRSDSS
ncbi:transposase InsO family protein [Mobiluncus mulieris]|uniref:Integrase core domain n=1 Tax=Mobiluncus mulieris TaxID=2052 RepID=A0A8G2M6B1_9ACTO|nr:transposase InsO family protein [Mobiluncus mulieris]STO17627.1 Integrase core domain [Mobiluncus mulieris]